MTLRSLDLIGRKFQCLTVVAKAPMHYARHQWLCECDCGNGTLIATAGKLFGNVATDCGCGIWKTVRKIGRPRGNTVFDNTLREAKA